MAAVDIKLTGQKQLIRKLDMLKATTARRVVRPAVVAGLTPINKAAKRNAPIRTKQLKRSLGKKVKLYKRRGVIFGAVGPRSGFKVVIDGQPVNPVNYAHLVEYGTAAHSINGVRHPGSPGTRFLTRAFDQSRRAAQRIFNTKVRQGLLKLAAKKT